VLVAHPQRVARKGRRGASLAHHPIWSLVIITLDIAAIWGSGHVSLRPGLTDPPPHGRGEMATKGGSGMDETTAPDVQRPSPGRRMAAAGALLGLVAAAVVVALGVFRNPVLLLLALGLIALAIVAAWTALVHRGLYRVLAAVVAVAALVGVTWLSVGSILRIVLLVALVVASTVAARVAYGRDVVEGPIGRGVGSAERGLLLMNPRSGGGKVVRFDLEAEAQRRGVRPVVLQAGDDLRALAEKAIADGADVIGMAGGDGSQALVADVARRHDVPFVCVPAGTRNHFALDLGLDRENVVAALDAFGEAIERRVDLAQIGDRIFVNNASLGVYATVVQSDAYRDAKLATTAQMLPDLLGPGVTGFDLRFERPDGRSESTADMVLISNNIYRLESMSGFGTRPRIDGGLLGVVTVTVDRARDLPALVSAEATGRIRQFHGYHAWTAAEFVVDSSEPVIDVGVDGEALRLPPPLHFRSLPGALRVRTPITAPGVSAATDAPQGLGQAVPALLRVLAGRPATPPAMAAP
jgi:diacylglycerol kinase family enzyme